MTTNLHQTQVTVFYFYIVTFLNIILCTAVRGKLIILGLGYIMKCQAYSKHHLYLLLLHSIKL